VIKKYDKEIAIEGNNAVLGLEEHLNKIVADLIGVELEIIKIARQCRLVSESALTNKVNHNISKDMKDIKTSKLTSNITINQKNSVVEKCAEFKIDTKKGYEKARIKLENFKEDFEKLRLILEETYQTSVNKKTQRKASRNTKKESKAKRESRAKKELEEISKQRKEKTLQYNTSKQTTTIESKLVYKQQNQSPVLEISKDYITI
ncbi:9818_t:CDS:2, partial [Cetraspora pellucida]